MAKPGLITASDCVNNQAYLCYAPHEQEKLRKLIITGLGKLYFALGSTFTFDRVEVITDLLLEDRKHETPETIIAFLHECAKGKFKFYGTPGIDQLQEKFCDFLQNTIIPARERERTKRQQEADKRFKQYERDRRKQESLRDALQRFKGPRT